MDFISDVSNAFGKQKALTFFLGHRFASQLRQSQSFQLCLFLFSHCVWIKFVSMAFDFFFVPCTSIDILLVVYPAIISFLPIAFKIDCVLQLGKIVVFLDWI